jgi:peptidyl-prolyl cis-trans isomerase D
MAKNDFIEFNKKVDFKYIVQKFTGGSDNNISISASDLKKYYNEHKYLYYNQTASRDIEYVSFDVVPSREDTTGVKEWIYKIRPDFISVGETDIESYVNNNSEETYNDKNYNESELPDSLKGFMFKASVGEVYGPYISDGAYKLARLHKIVSVSDSVKARHILIAPKGNDKTDMDKAKITADSIKGLIDKGADFAVLAKTYSVDKSNSEKGGDLGWFTENKMVKPFNDAAFESKKGEIKVVESNYGYHILQVLDKSPDKKKVKVAIILKKMIPSKQT